MEVIVKLIPCYHFFGPLCRLCVGYSSLDVIQRVLLPILWTLSCYIHTYMVDPKCGD